VPRVIFLVTKIPLRKGWKNFNISYHTFSGKEIPHHLCCGFAETGPDPILAPMQRLHPRGQTPRRSRPHSLVSPNDDDKRSSRLCTCSDTNLEQQQQQQQLRIKTIDNISRGRPYMTSHNFEQFLTTFPYKIFINSQ
jgi:hypothetical protein